METLYSYKNGNCNVTIYDDGTKIREYEGDPKPVHPESMDIKISNNCSGGCKWCHEKSNPSGLHADLDRLLDVIKGLPAGVEVALGGGNPLTHPGLMPFLTTLKERGLIANMTINQKHFKSYQDQIKQIVSEGLIKGIGVSYSSDDWLQDISPIMELTNNMVFHVIMGINPVEVVEELNSFCMMHDKPCKVLVLGYKEYGLGGNYYTTAQVAIEKNKLEWYRRLALEFKTNNLTLSFDNLAISQLKLRRYFTDKAWNKFFMGKEGKYSMFVDAVKQEYAICSVDPNRVSWDDIDLFSFFQNIKVQDY